MTVSTAHDGTDASNSPDQIVMKLGDADAMLSAGQDSAVVLQTLEVSESRMDVGGDSTVG